MAHKMDAVIVLRIPARLKEAVEAQAASLDRPASWLIRNTMEVYLQSLKEKKDVASS